MAHNKVLTNYSLLLGPLKASIHKGLYVCLIMCNLIMQIYAEWNKYKLRNLSGINHEETIKGTIKKTGIFTLFVIILALFNMMMNIIFPSKAKNQNYFLCQDLISIFLRSVILPIIIAVTNPGMSKYLKQYLSSTSTFERGNEFLQHVNNAIARLVIKRQNQIVPLE